jgi:peptidylprolyl isomerase
VEYVGWVYGTDKSQPFDTSGRHDKPFEFVLGKGEAIAGWDQGLAGMKAGGTRKLTIPSDLAYGARGALNGRIPPNAALEFDVELLDVITPLPELPPTSVRALVVEDRIAGTGTEAKAGSSLTVHYTGWLEDGTQFDSSRDASRDRDQPIEFMLGRGEVIAGWEQGLLGMKVGGIRKLIIPPDLGYGAQGASNFIPPNAVLIFEVELLAVR